MAEQFSLRWNNFHSNLSSGFHELMEANDMVDVTLAVEGQFLQAHKIVLSICSPLFKQLFKINPCKHPVIILRDVSYGNLKDILAFMYLGEVNVLRDNLSSFLRTAELLQVKGLTGDDSSDTSSKKDKSDSICDNEIEQDMQQFGQLIHSSETQLPSPPTVNSNKRISKSCNAQTKRSKSDAQSNAISTKRERSPTPTQVADDDSDYVQTSNVKHESLLYTSENEDGANQEQILDCKSMNRSTLQDASSQDHVVNFGQEWEVGHIRTKTPYRVGTGHEIVADIGVNIGLRCVNVTLKSKPDGPLANEIIDYNERFEWAWDQGNFGFGPYAGHLQQQFRAAQYRGTPLPILWVIDYFVIDGEGHRFGRFYRTAGWYSHILIWAALPCWLLAVILFRTVIRYGGYCLLLCGALLVVANIIWSVIRNPMPLSIPFEDAIIVMKFGFSYWLCLFTGITCIILSIVIIVMEANYDETISIFFGVDPLTCLDEYILSQSEIQLLRNKNKIIADIQLSEMQPSTSAAENPLTDDLQSIYLKRKTSLKFTGPTHRMRRAHRRNKDDEQPLYGNMETIRKYDPQAASPV